MKGSVMLLSHPLAGTDRGTVLSKAALRAADHLAVSARLLAQIIGVSEPSISRMKKGEFALEDGSKAYELAAVFVRVFRSLDAISGGDKATARAWLLGENLALGGRPLDRITTVTGLTDVATYLDARRAVV
jgi:hypothetical protein